MPGTGIDVYGQALDAGKIDSNFIRDNLRAVFGFWQAHGVDTANGGFWNGVEIAGPPHLPSPSDQKSEFAQGDAALRVLLSA